VKQHYLALDIPEDELSAAIAQEAAIRDDDLDDLERRLATAEPASAAALALAIGRAGRSESADAIHRALEQVNGAGRSLEAAAIQMALDLLPVAPPSSIERGERGYRRVDASRDEELLVEDPIAAHWHHLGRWGPPLRAEPDRPQRFLQGDIDVERAVDEAQKGRILIVGFRPSPWRIRPHAPLRLMRAGLSRDARLAMMVRWSRVRSVGAVEGRRGPRAAFETGNTVEPLPWNASIPVPLLIDLMTRLLKHARP
jgi:hypothetical protein